MGLAASASLRNVFTKFVLNIDYLRCGYHSALHFRSEVSFYFELYVGSYNIFCE